MKKLEKLGLRQAQDWQKERLACWMYEWHLMQVSGKVDDEVGVPEYLCPSCDDQIPKDCFAPMDRSVEVGQIRLMAPVAEEDMVHIAVVSIALDGSVSCLPFSPFSEPATPDELLSGRNTAVVRVYCLWNIRVVHKNIVNRSWVVDRLDAQECERLTIAVNAYKKDGQLPDTLLSDVGSLLVHPEDPRREYRRQEKQRIDLALPTNVAVRECSVNYNIESDQQEFLKAAEPGENYESQTE